MRRAFLFLFALSLVLPVTEAIASCNILGQKVDNNASILTNCTIYNDDTPEFVEADAGLVCREGYAYLENPWTVGSNQWVCASTQKYGYFHPWYVVSPISIPTIDKTAICPGEKVTIKYPRFNFRCINGSLHAITPAIILQASVDNTLLGDNCPKRPTPLSQRCNVCQTESTACSTKISFSPSGNPGESLELSSSIATKYDYSITRNHLPFAHFDNSTIRFLDYSFLLSTDRLAYNLLEEQNKIQVIGSSSCCGEPGQKVVLELQDKNGAVLASTIATIQVDRSFSGTLKIPASTLTGDYVVSAKTMASSNEKCKEKKEVFINSNKPPLPDFSFVPTEGIAPLVVQFDASASSDPDSSIAAYYWDFGDGEKGTGKSVSHRFEEGGNYTVRLAVQDNQGIVSFLAKNLLVTETRSVTNLDATNALLGENNQLAIACKNVGNEKALLVFTNANGQTVNQQGQPEEISYKLSCGVAQSFGPWLEKGAFTAIATIQKPCSRCSIKTSFVVSTASNLTIPETHPLLSLAVLFAIYFIMGMFKK